ncbi:hypothetical protein RRG08_025622 [Elysia crispata]|uniref:Uncharacterized protein n=1 Tax=Elysia crispata TaxID=231223 RepID=A0AAE0YEK1_9GAST|nr:hypothetical protein RRG08_025622 [Elysia crispata]
MRTNPFRAPSTRPCRRHLITNVGNELSFTGGSRSPNGPNGCLSVQGINPMTGPIRPELLALRYDLFDAKLSPLIQPKPSTQTREGE